MKKIVRIITEESVKTNQVKHKTQSNILTQSRFLKNTEERVKTTNRSQLLQA